MHTSVMVANSGEQESRDLGALLESHHYRIIWANALTNLESQIRESDCQALILDLDRFSVDNRFIRELSRQRPGLFIIALSSRRFHPELQEAMSFHISACLVKPVDMDELLFWLRSLGDR
jgi:DNA-binding response OmpR family regulator